MKVTLLSLLLTAAAFAADGPLDATLNAWKQAAIHKDGAALEKLYHKDLTYTHSSAKVENKAESIAAGMKAPPKAIEFLDPTTRVYGNTAIVKSKVDITNEKDVTSHLEILMVWLKSGSSWQLVARQATKLP